MSLSPRSIIRTRILLRANLLLLVVQKCRRLYKSVFTFHNVTYRLSILAPHCWFMTTNGSDGAYVLLAALAHVAHDMTFNKRDIETLRITLRSKNCTFILKYCFRSVKSRNLSSTRRAFVNFILVLRLLFYLSIRLNMHENP